jgi:hypothetical protein
MNVVRNDDGITQSGGDEVWHVEQALSILMPQCSGHNVSAPP